MKDVTGGVTAPKGFKAGAVECGIKYSGRLDLGMILSDVDAVAAGMFTTNRIKSAPVLVSRDHIRGGKARAIIANSGNANACTGESGREAALATAASTAEIIGCEPEEVLVASTGVIGHELPIEKILNRIPELVDSLSVTGNNQIAGAIMTTDTVPKETAVEIDINGVPVKIGATAKGAGMICPNMATMFCFLTTDAAVEPSSLRKALSTAVHASFNCITVDGDMSPNDTVFVIANGLAENLPIKSGTKEFTLFVEGLTEVCTRMAKALVRDGEGATKFITLRITGAQSVEDARKAGLAIANSPLVKTAFFGADPNWGRIICAAGASGISVDENNIIISLNSFELFKHGSPTNFNETALRSSLGQRDITCDVDLGMGYAEAVIYTSDISYEYIKINAEYTT